MSFLRHPLIATFVMISMGCTATSSRDADPTRQPWRDSWDALPAAKAGDSEGLHRLFAAAESQLELPYVNAGEDAEAIYENMGVVLESIGDRRFSEALLREDPQTRSAAREFISQEKVREEFPRTHQILVEAPSVEWPSDQVEAQWHIEQGKAPPPKERWTR